MLEKIAEYFCKDKKQGMKEFALIIRILMLTLFIIIMFGIILPQLISQKSTLAVVVGLVLLLLSLLGIFLSILRMRKKYQE